MGNMIVKVNKPEIDVTTANTVYNSTLVRVYAAALAVVTVKDSGGNVRGSVTMPAGEIDIFEKLATDTIEATSVLKCSPAAYK